MKLHMSQMHPKFQSLMKPKCRDMIIHLKRIMISKNTSVIRLHQVMPVILWLEIPQNANVNTPP